ncbi:hypothetical protein [Pseudoalteromonas luteoviolacea]|uniref:hypothetical protein n=1 Tax=Pseudoalteromonas luteoviolacea TaxID=43657 RepID=UPI001151F46F|nr:hypothetical protein [Pseudoalteromonas luteoviolacea]TQF71773.1 hypothetical protein FLM44_12120 [Pseudoalteromonas luteoviolacea]
MSKNKILELCENYLSEAVTEKSVTDPDNPSEERREIRVNFSPAQQFSLLENGVKFEELDHSELKSALLGLSKMLLLPSSITIKTKDHNYLWAWCAHIILAPSQTPAFFTDDEYDLKQLLETCVFAALSSMTRQVTNPEEHYNRYEHITFNQRMFLENKSNALAYLVFPLLEGVCKKLCSEYVAMDGKVVNEFSGVSNGRPYNLGRICSSLGDLLFLTSREFPCEELDKIMEQIHTFDGSKSAFKTIYGWRNQSLHGERKFNNVTALLLNLVFLLIINSIEEDFENIKSDALLSVGMKDCKWYFYPPQL